MKISAGYVWRVPLQLRTPIRTARTVLNQRNVLIVELHSAQGARGYGECPTFPTAWYLPETLGDDEAVLPVLLEALAGIEVKHPSDVHRVLRQIPEAACTPFARSAIDNAVWDLCARQASMPLVHYMGLQGGSAPGGIVVPLIGSDVCLDMVARAVDAGYGRVKIKISQPDDVETLRRARQAFPHLTLMADANGAFDEETFMSFHADMDQVGLACIEEPLARHIDEAGEDFYGRLAGVQRRIGTPICLDESWTNIDELRLAFRFPDIRWFAIKAGKLGGITPTLDVLNYASAHGLRVWMGGMFDTGISKAVHAALSLHPANSVPGDISDTSRYFVDDACSPPFVLHNGLLACDRLGIGFVLDEKIERHLLCSV